MNKEIIEKIKTVKDASELKDVANKNGISLTEDEAKGYFNLYHNVGKVNEEELDNVTGGATCVGGKHYSSDTGHYLIVTWGNSCANQYDNPNYPGVSGTCLKCTFHIREGFVTYCTKRSLDDDPYNDKIGTTHKPGPGGRYWDIHGNYYN